MSWSAGREKKAIESNDQIVKILQTVNEVLKKLSNDTDLREDLSLQIVKDAILHWTNIKRLSQEEASKFEDNYRIISVLQKLQTLQHVCNIAKLSVPLDHFLQSQPRLSPDLIEQKYGREILQEFYLNDPDYSKLKSKAPSLSPSPSSPSSDLKHSQINLESESEAESEDSDIKNDASNKSLENYLSKCNDSLLEISKAAAKLKENKLNIVDGDDENVKSKSILTIILNWGMEDLDSPRFSWYRYIVRTAINASLCALLCYILTPYLHQFYQESGSGSGSGSVKSYTIAQESAADGILL